MACRVMYNYVESVLRCSTQYCNGAATQLVGGKPDLRVWLKADVKELLSVKRGDQQRKVQKMRCAAACENPELQTTLEMSLEGCIWNVINLLINSLKKYLLPWGLA